MKAPYKKMATKVSPASTSLSSEPAIPAIGKPEFAPSHGLLPKRWNQTKKEANYNLHKAVRDGNVAEVERLLNSSADADAPDKEEYGARPLLYAAMQGRRLLFEPPNYGWDVATKLVGLLLKAGADVTLTDKLGFTALHLAASLGCIDIVRMLLDACPDAKAKKDLIDLQDKEIQRTSLHCATEKGHVEVVQLLVDSGGDVHKKYDRISLTPWQLAVYEGQALHLFQNLLALMKKGANLEPQQLMALLIELDGTEEQVAEMVAVIEVTHKDPMDAAWATMAEAIHASKTKFVDYLLTTILKEMPEAVVLLTRKPWVDTLLAMATSFPDSFQHLIRQLEFLDEKILRQFVEGLNLESFLHDSDTMQDAYRNLLFKQLVLGMDGVAYPTLKIFLESLGDKFLQEMAKFPSFFRQLPRFLSEHENVTADARLLKWTMPTDELVLFNIRPLMLAAVRSRIPENVEAVVTHIMKWLESNKDCFITGLDADIMQDFAGQFPAVASALLSMDMLGERISNPEVVSVPAEVLASGEDEFRCSDTMLTYIWQQEEMAYLNKEGIPRQQVDEFVRQGLGIKVLVKAIRANADVEHIRFLMDPSLSGNESLANTPGLSGREVSQLITYGADPDTVWAAIENGIQVSTIQAMLRAKLVFQIVDIMLGKEIDYTTRYWNMRTKPVWKTFEPESYRTGITYPFVVRFLQAWQESVADTPDEKGNKPRGFNNKNFIDMVFHYNDPLYAKLKTVWDFKGSDRAETFREKGLTSYFWNTEIFVHYMTVVRAFATPNWLLHRWVVAYSIMVGWFAWRGLGDLASRVMFWVTPPQRYQTSGSAVVVPIADTVVTGRKNLLKGLMNADVASSWYGLPIVRAIIHTEWNAYARLFMFLSTVEHIAFMVLFGIFLLCYWPEDDNLTLLEVLQTRRFVLAIACESILGYMSMAGLVLEMQQFRNLGFLWVTQPGNYLDTFSYLLIYAILVSHLVRTDRSVIVAIAAIETLILFLRLAFFAMMTDSLGSLVRMVIEIIKDMRYFFFILVIIFGGFAIAFSMLLPQGVNNQEQTNLYVHLFTMMAAGDFGNDFLSAILFPDISNSDVNWENRQLTVILFSIYIILVLIVLINLLISLMGDTFDRIKDSEEVEVLKNKAQIIVEIESFLPEEQLNRIRKNLLGPYLHILQPIKKSFGEHDESQGWKGRITQIKESLRQELRRVFQTNGRGGPPAPGAAGGPMAAQPPALPGGTGAASGTHPPPAGTAGPPGKPPSKRQAMRAQDSFWAPDAPSGDEDEEDAQSAMLLASRQNSHGSHGSIGAGMAVAMAGMAGDLVVEARLNAMDQQVAALTQKVDQLLKNSARTQLALNELLKLTQ